MDDSILLKDVVADRDIQDYLRDLSIVVNKSDIQPSLSDEEAYSIGSEAFYCLLGLERDKQTLYAKLRELSKVNTFLGKANPEEQFIDDVVQAELNKEAGHVGKETIRRIRKNVAQSPHPVVQLLPFDDIIKEHIIASGRYLHSMLWKEVVGTPLEDVTTFSQLINRSGAGFDLYKKIVEYNGSRRYSRQNPILGKPATEDDYLRIGMDVLYVMAVEAGAYTSKKEDFVAAVIEYLKPVIDVRQDQRLRYCINGHPISLKQVKELVTGQTELVGPIIGLGKEYCADVSEYRADYCKLMTVNAIGAALFLGVAAYFFDQIKFEGRYSDPIIEFMKNALIDVVKSMNSVMNRVGL